MNSPFPSRRDFLRNTLGGFGYLSFAGLSTQAALSRGAMFPARAKRVIMMFMQGGVSLAGKVPTNTPATLANLWVGYAITPQLQASAGVRHVGKVYANAANTQWQAAYMLLDLGLAWKINKTSTLTGRIRNATDRVYAANLSSQAYLGAPRTADVTLHVAF